jgi:hypothetical protein
MDMQDNGWSTSSFHHQEIPEEHASFGCHFLILVLSVDRAYVPFRCAIAQRDGPVRDSLGVRKTARGDEAGGRHSSDSMGALLPGTGPSSTSDIRCADATLASLKRLSCAIAISSSGATPPSIQLGGVVRLRVSRIWPGSVRIRVSVPKVNVGDRVELNTGRSHP